MRSKIGTKSRLAAHIIALAVLVLLLIFAEAPAKPASPLDTSPSGTAGPVEVTAGSVADATATMEKVVTPVTADRVPADRLRPPDGDGAETAPPAAVPLPDIGTPPPASPETLDSASALQPASEPVRPSPQATETPAAAGAENAGGDAAAEPPADAVAPVPGPEDAGEEPAMAVQPDESGSIVVPEPETGADAPAAATTPLADAGLEVLGDNVYWLDTSRDPEVDLSVIPDTGTLIVLTPLPGYRVQGFEHVKTEVIPADIDDLTPDAAERYLHLTSDAALPTITLVMPGVPGAAFFKGAYFLARRNLSMDGLMRELEPELQEAGAARDEIVHRLRRLRD